MMKIAFYKLFLLSFLSLIVTSCGTTKNSTLSNDLSDGVDTSAVHTDANDFTTVIIRKRLEREINNSYIFSIDGVQLYQNPNNDFSIYNFAESIDDVNYNSYTIVLNSDSKFVMDNLDSQAYNDIKKVLEETGKNYMLLKGNFSTTMDFQGDNSPDFVLKNETNFKSDVNSSEQIFLYDGKNKLTATEIKALTSYSYNEQDELDGEKEELSWLDGAQSTSELPKIKVDHLHVDHYNYVNSSGKEAWKRIEVSYSLFWRWSRELAQWETGVMTMDRDQDLYNFYQDTLYFLGSLEWLKIDPKLTIKENCQNGGPNYQVILPLVDELNDAYIVDDNENDIATYLLLSIVELDPNLHLMYIVRSEKFTEANINGTPEFNDLELLKTTYRIENKKDFTDQISTENTLFTKNFRKYPYVPCNR